ncbi:D-alanyl-D-alanine carboxypeptidase/D-alanyl-D-alanine-endopeptidase [Pradoshia eiseniae]|uniref:D-alanyl-D-alanine carboxypeptidase/D-alanyl-D-alanine-endopeptidase n=1 Tax=Pradoshia eiseniae TaxID=2064768 RepID=A0A2S7N165_9BACI|nr:D-alanyl-D-alanine carboxypeptidase/D-alanyl-D-alanine-endopeptidase [Pradoshia eiseniae]PQD95725.1 D-alanyl-D-alanine carboxypeptidase/D-alanyl-D-alanine-endopeptidase [Pradoshia eiseniae]
MPKSKKSMTALFMVLVLCIIPLSWYSEYQAGPEDGLNAKITNVLKHEELKGSITGISIRNATTGEIIYEKNGDTRLRPASSMKLVTGATALKLLGDNYRFKTEVYADKRARNGVLTGNLYLKGYGDPTLTVDDLDRISDQLKKKGIRRIKGNLIADDTWYDDTRLSLDLPWSDEQEYYGAQISGLTLSPDTDYDAGTVIVQVTPAAKEGKAPTITVSPQTSYVKIYNKAETGNTDSKKTIKITRKHGTNQLYITGSIPKNASASKSWMAVENPSGYTLDIFKRSLAKSGITVTGKAVNGKLKPGAIMLAADQSPQLKEIMKPYLKLSNNTISEVLVKEAGRVAGKEGSWEEGLAVIQDHYEYLGLKERDILMRDGSGVSHVSLITPNSLSNLLYQAQSKPWYTTYYDSLPVAGISDRTVGGTLRNRMRGTPAEGKIIAKTGSISTVSSLSGYVKGDTGNKYTFSIIINNAIDEDGLKDIEDEIAIILASDEGN